MCVCLSVRVCMCVCVFRTGTVGLHDGLGAGRALAPLPRAGQLNSDLVARGRLQVHQGDGPAVAVH